MTGSQQKRKAAVDYVLGTLVFDSLRTLREIIRSEVCEQNKHDLMAKTDATEEYLMFAYLNHIGMDADALHDSSFSLEALEDNLSSEVGESLQQSTCISCHAWLLSRLFKMSSKHWKQLGKTQ